MVRKLSQQAVEVRANMCDGQGDVRLRALLNGDEEMNGKGRLFKLISIPVGGSIGFHVHTGETETFYIATGQGEFDDNGTATPFSAGDVLHTDDGQGHAVKNTGSVPVEMVALILYV